MQNRRTISLIMLLAMGLGQGCSTFAQASYDKSLSWADIRTLDLKRAMNSEYGSYANLYERNLPAGTHHLVLNDSDDRIDDPFKTPQPMRELVGFWLKIYTQYSTKNLVIFDRKHPEVIYEAMDFRDLAKTSRNAMAYEIVREQRVKKRIAEYRQAFAQLVKLKKRIKTLTPETKGLSVVQKNILNAISSSQHQHSLAEWSRGMRAQTGQRDNVIKGLLSAETFMPKMEEIFTQLDLPKELTRLPLVESSFNIAAHSKAGAVGVWQFMPLSGKEYMRVDPAPGIDERRSPLKSTIAAARLLKRNLVMTGNWPLAITAYNHGFTGIKRLTPKERASAIEGSLFQPCQKKKHLGYASSNYYAEFLAMVHAEAYRDVYYGESPLPVTPPLKFHRIKESKSAFQYALNAGVSLHDVQLFNPDIRNLKAKLPVGYYIATPGHEGEIDDLIGSIRAKRVFKPKRIAVTSN